MSNSQFLQKIVIVLGGLSLIYAMTKLDLGFSIFDKDNLYFALMTPINLLYVFAILWGPFKERKTRFKIFRIDWVEWEKAGITKFVAFIGSFYLSFGIVILAAMLIIFVIIFTPEIDKVKVDLFLILHFIILFSCSYFIAHRTWKHHQNITGEFPGWLE